MTESEIRSLVDQWIDAWNSHDTERDRELYAEDAVLYQAPMKKSLTGVDHIIARGKYFMEMSNDSRISVRDLYVVDDTAIMEFNISGTNTGPFLGHPSTGRKFDIDSCIVFKIKDGKIVKHTTYVDTASILRAIGIIAIPEAPAEAV